MLEVYRHEVTQLAAPALAEALNNASTSHDSLVAKATGR